MNCPFEFLFYQIFTVIDDNKKPQNMHTGEFVLVDDAYQYRQV